VALICGREPVGRLDIHSAANSWLIGMPTSATLPGCSFPLSGNKPHAGICGGTLSCRPHEARDAQRIGIVSSAICRQASGAIVSRSDPLTLAWRCGILEA
jgi:hypothetical protein